HLPYTRHDETMNVYSIYTFPMKVPGDRGFITQLQDFPKFVATHLASGMVGELTELPRHDLIESSSVLWHGRESCAFRLLSDSTDDIHEIFRFTASRAEIEPSWKRLTEHEYILSNYNNITMLCGPNNTVQPPPFTAPCTPCYLRIGCGCHIRTQSGQSLLDSARREDASELDDCERHWYTKTPVLHSVNLAVMRQFYDMTNKSILGRDLFPPSEMEDHPPIDWPLFSDNTSELLSRDKEAGYDLSKLSEGLQNKSVIFHSSSEAVLHDFMSKFQEFKLGNLEIGLITGVCLLLLTNLCLILKVKSHGKRIHELSLAVLARCQRFPLTQSFVLKNDPTKTTKTEVEMLGVAPADLTGYDPYITIALSFVICVSLSLYILKVALQRRCSVYIDICSQTESIQLKVAELPTAR